MPRSLPDVPDYIDALRLSEQDRQALVNELERTAGAPGREKRRSKRMPYNEVPALILQVTHPGGTTVRFLVKPRNISSQGLSVLHGGFVHPGTRCSVPLKDMRGLATRIDGKIVSCRLIRGRVHELGIQFCRSIPIEEYVLDTTSGDAEGRITVALPSLQGRVLVADEWQDDRQLLCYDLQKLGLETLEADGGAEVIRRIRNGHYDLIVVGEWLGDQTAADLAGALHDLKCTTPIIGIFSSGSNDALVAKAKAAGVRAILQRPYALEQLAETLLQVTTNGRSKPSDADETDLSVRWVEMGMRPMILAFLQSLEIRLGDLERQIRAVSKAHDPVHSCLRLKGAAASYGFPHISAAAEELAQRLADNAPLDTVKQAMNELAGLAANALDTAMRRIEQA